VVAEAVRHGGLKITSLGGASKLPFFARATKDSVCDVHAFMDNDDEANVAIASALGESILAQSEITQATCPGLRESEFEDLLDPAIYADIAAD
jgi:hypothetical protein